MKIIIRSDKKCSAKKQQLTWWKIVTSYLFIISVSQKMSWNGSILTDRKLTVKKTLIHQATVVGYLIHLSDRPILEYKLNDLLYLFSFEAELLLRQKRTGMKLFESVFQNGGVWQTIIKVMKVCPCKTDQV